jgi:hypothetical protein
MNEWLVSAFSAISAVVGFLLYSNATRFLQRTRNNVISAVAYDIVKRISNPYGKNINWWYKIKIILGTFFRYLGLLLFIGGIICLFVSMAKLIP